MIFFQFVQPFEISKRKKKKKKIIPFFQLIFNQKLFLASSHRLYFMYNIDVAWQNYANEY